MAKKSPEEKRQILVNYFKTTYDHNYDKISQFMEYIWPIYNMVQSSTQYWNGFNSSGISKFDIEWEKLARSKDFIQSQKLVEDFYRELGIDVNFDELMKDGTLDIKFFDKNDPDNNNNYLAGNFQGSIGISNYHPYIEVMDQGFVLDASVYAHEIGHYINENFGRDTFGRELLTESVAHFFELLFADYLCERGYEYDGTISKRLVQYTLYHCSWDALYIFRLFILFLKYNDINEEKYNEDFGGTLFNDVIDRCYEVIIEKHTLRARIKHSIAFSLSIYMYIKYKNDKEFIEAVKKLNDKMMKDYTIEELLTIIGITGFDNDNMKKILASFESFKEMLIGYSKRSI